MRRWIISSVSIIFFFVLSTSVLAASIASHVYGRILLSVGEHGEVWYVDPLTGSSDVLGWPEEALRVLQRKALGITNAQLDEIPIATNNTTGNLLLWWRLSGRILLQVQPHGEARYVDPVNLKRYSLQTTKQTLFLMHSLVLRHYPNKYCTNPSRGTKNNCRCSPKKSTFHISNATWRMNRPATSRRLWRSVRHAGSRLDT